VTGGESNQIQIKKLPAHKIFEISIITDFCSRKGSCRKLNPDCLQRKKFGLVLHKKPSDG